MERSPHTHFFLCKLVPKQKATDMCDPEMLDYFSSFPTIILKMHLVYRKHVYRVYLYHWHGQSKEIVWLIWRFFKRYAFSLNLGSCAPIKRKKRKKFFFVFCYFSMNYVTVSQIKPCLNNSNRILSQKLILSSKNSKFSKFRKFQSAKKRHISKFLNEKWLDIMEMSWGSNNKSWGWIFEVFDYAQILFKECYLPQICDFWV